MRGSNGWTENSINSIEPITNEDVEKLKKDSPKQSSVNVEDNISINSDLLNAKNELQGNMPQNGQVREPRISEVKDNTNKSKEQSIKPQSQVTPSVNKQSKNKRVYIIPAIVLSVLGTLVTCLLILWILCSKGVVTIGNNLNSTTTESIITSENQVYTEQVTSEMIIESSETESTIEDLVTSEQSIEELTEDLETPDINDFIINEEDERIPEIGNSAIGYVNIPTTFITENIEKPEDLLDCCFATNVDGSQKVYLAKTQYVSLLDFKDIIIKELESKGFATTSYNTVKGEYEMSVYSSESTEGIIDYYIFNSKNDDYVRYVKLEYIRGTELESFDFIYHEN